MIKLLESGMIFSFEDDSFFHIETEKNKLISCRRHVKVCECVVCPGSGRHRDKVLFIEAKSSAPNKANCKIGNVTNDSRLISGNWRLLTPIDVFSREICQKFIDSFSMWQSFHDGFHQPKGHKINMPPNAHKVQRGDQPLFILVLNNFNDTWLEPVKNAIEDEMRHFMQAWNISPTALKVVNQQMARDIIGLNVEQDNNFSGRRFRRKHT